ncbi:MAG: HD domain-containing phosphohydrolase [Acidobacteriota bacterium]
MSRQKIYYLADQKLAVFIEKLQPHFETTPLRPAETANITGVVLATVAGLSITSPLARPSPQRCLILVGNERKFAALPAELINSIYAFLPNSAPYTFVCQQIENALRFLQLHETAESAQTRLEWQTQIMYELNHVGMALTSERDMEKLLEMIVSKSREVTRSDAASLYLVESASDGSSRLRFKFAQNQSIKQKLTEFTIPISYQSMAGFVAETGIPLAIEDVYNLPAEAPYIFNRSFDEETGYRTKSMLVVPMPNAFNEVIGVLQLINHKLDPAAKLVSAAAVESQVIPYPQDLVDVVASLGSQAAVALENSMLYQNIKKLFEGFVSAAVTAIEQRDPTTSGHSARVADLTVALAELVDRINEPPFSGISFNCDQLTEIRYASLLHDFGKVGVREEVLVKAKKLYPLQLELLRWRFDYYRQVRRVGSSQRKLDYLLAQGRDAYLASQPDLDCELERELSEIDEMWSIVLKSNEPTVLAEGSFERLLTIAAHTFELFDGSQAPLLSAEEIHTLSIPRGSLSDTERREIEQHAYHTFVFLSQIPWLQEWKNIPRIAGYHHEKLNGRGYPYGVSAAEIPIQSRMMSISDIFDALTASDRPYKKAVPVEKALSIIESEVKAGQLDLELFRLFLASKVYERVLVAS